MAKKKIAQMVQVEQNQDSTTPVKEKDFFSRFVTKMYSCFENKQIKKRLWIVIGVSCFAIIMLVSWLMWWQWQKSELSHQYYQASIDFFERIGEIQNQQTLGIQPSDDELNKLSKPYLEILEAPVQSVETFLSQYQLGILYYSIQDYANASKYFQLAYANKDKFVLAPQALLNLGHAFFNLADAQLKMKKTGQAIQHYQSALNSYLKMEQEFQNSPHYILSLRYKGMLNEALALAYEKNGDKKNVIKALKQAEKSYQTLKSVKMTKQLSSYFIYRHPSEEADLGLIRVRTSLKMKH